MSDDADSFAEEESRRKRLIEQLKTAPIVDLIGVVDASGAGGCLSRGEDLWTLRVTLEGWRFENGHFHKSCLNLCQELPEPQLKRLMDLIQPNSVMRFTARVTTDPKLGTSAGLLESVIGVESSDKELNEFAEQLQKPVTFVDPTLGTFTLDRRVNWFSAVVDWNGGSVRLSLSATKYPELDEALKVAHSLYLGQEEWNRRIRDYAVKELLAVKNESWIDQDEPELTPDDFKDRMTLESITVDPNGSFDFWHDDGDLFWGHAIQIGGNLAEGPKYADTPG